MMKTILMATTLLLGSAAFAQTAPDAKPMQTEAEAAAVRAAKEAEAADMAAMPVSLDKAGLAALEKEAAAAPAINAKLRSAGIVPADKAVTRLAAYNAGEDALAGHMDQSAMGGPLEERAGYPPCSPGPGDDNCIQLYEPGVTGAGN